MLTTVHIIDLWALSAGVVPSGVVSIRRVQEEALLADAIGLRLHRHKTFSALRALSIDGGPHSEVAADGPVRVLGTKIARRLPLQCRHVPRGRAPKHKHMPLHISVLQGRVPAI